MIKKENHRFPASCIGTFRRYLAVMTQFDEIGIHLWGCYRNSQLNLQFKQNIMQKLTPQRSKNKAFLIVMLKIFFFFNSGVRNQKAYLFSYTNPKLLPLMSRRQKYFMSCIAPHPSYGSLSTCIGEKFRRKLKNLKIELIYSWVIWTHR